MQSKAVCARWRWRWRWRCGDGDLIYSGDLMHSGDLNIGNIWIVNFYSFIIQMVPCIWILKRTSKNSLFRCFHYSNPHCPYSSPHLPLHISITIFLSTSPSPSSSPHIFISISTWIDLNVVSAVRQLKWLQRTAHTIEIYKLQLLLHVPTYLLALKRLGSLMSTPNTLKLLNKCMLPHVN